ncbi:hypothetical protein [Flavobacterium humidisoli]|jgi:hypothetical protein|uniref:Uncharacterized protein n=1 Tax=Flavobacterium humidisoli TaxID=2937442 RepID=A0ABY4LPZ8_9FLAO|nr:hypothetical protein [Flavobacterium humidisoli]UPZ14323.1 hypothetical protein M0M44_16320 [Flavobacterium humidisoli]
MERAIKLQVRKELDGKQEVNIIKLKGSLITKGYTEIIHIIDKDDEFYINSFATKTEASKEVKEFILDFINKENLSNTISVLA